MLSANEDFDAFRDELMNMGAKIGLVTLSRDAQNPKELTIFKGEYVEVFCLDHFPADIEKLRKTNIPADNGAVRLRLPQLSLVAVGSIILILALKS